MCLSIIDGILFLSYYRLSGLQKEGIMKKEEKTGLTKERILLAAMEEFGERGMPRPR